MKRLLLFLVPAASIGQIVEVIPPAELVEEVVELVPPVVEVVPPTVVELHEEQRLDPLDPAFVRRQLSIDPRIVEVPPGGVEVERTVERRIYDPRRGVVVVVEEEQARELPYVTLPVLFRKNTAELLDGESWRALEEMAALVLEVSRSEPGATFDIEGHTSTDGPDDFNLRLSADRARRVYDELTRRYSVPRSMLTAHGYGENYPMYPNGTEREMMLDRRVLIVRTR
jgi:outer membrane protein OmpA-like peptidoglycan-associated protein